MEDQTAQECLTLARLLALEKEKRIAAERVVETERQALLELKSRLDKSNSFNSSSSPHQDQISRSLSNSSGISSPLPRAFSQEFYETVLHELPDDVQSTLCVQQETPAATGDIDIVVSSPFTRANFAIERNNPKLLRQILEEDRQGGNLTIVKCGTQLLNSAIEIGSVGCVKVLLEGGCSPNESGLSELPPLHLAVTNGHTSCLKVLLGYGGEIDLTDAKGYTATHLAMKNNQLTSVDALLKARPNIFSVTLGGQTLLHAAVHSNLDKILRTLLVELRSFPNPDISISDFVNKQDQDGYTALHLAASNGYKNCVEILCACPEVDTSLVCSNGNTPLDIAATTNEECQIILSTKSYKEAKLVIFTGETTRPQYTVGQVKILSHHDWDDVLWLVKGLLQEYDHVLNEKIEPNFRESQMILSSSSKHQSSSIKEDLYSLTQMESVKLAEEMKTIIKSRQNTFHTSDISSYTNQCSIGNYNNDRAIISPYNALRELEEKGEPLEVCVQLKSNLERISFISLHPLSILKDYTNLLMKSKSVIIHGPPETDLNILLGQMSASLKTMSPSRIEKIHLPLTPNFTRAHAICLLYDNGLLQLDNEDFTTMGGCSLLVMEGIDKLKDFDSLTTLHMLLTQFEEWQGVWLDLNDGRHVSSVPPGKYRLIRQCYVLATRTLFNSSSELPKEVMDSYGHIWLADTEEPTVGFLLRNYIRELIDTRKGRLPSKSDHVYQAIVWVWQFWLLYNYYMHQLDLFHLTIGPKLFLNCPVQSNDADNIYNWFAELWSFHLIPKIKNTFFITIGNDKHKQHKNSRMNNFKNIIFFLIYRLVETTCPLPSEATSEFLLALQESHDVGVVSNSSPQLLAKDIGKGIKLTKSPKPDRKGSLKKSNTVDIKESGGKTQNELDIPIAAVHKKYQSSDNLPLPAAVIEAERLSKITSRPKSGGLFSKNSTLRKSFFKGSKTSLYALEEEDQKNKKKKKKKQPQEEGEKGEEDIEQLFDVLLTSGSHRLDEQRAMSPPHHIITVTTSPHTSPPQTTPTQHSPSHSLTDKMEPMLRPLSADSMSRSSEHVSNGLAANTRKAHPRVSNLLESHTLPRLRSRSEDNVYMTTNLSSDELPSSSTSKLISQTSIPSHHSHHVSISSDALSDSLERQSLTDSDSFNSSLNNSSNFDMIKQQQFDQNPLAKETPFVAKEVTYVAKETNGSTSTEVTKENDDIITNSPLTRRLSKSYQVLYSASLGYCSSLPPLRKTSVPAVSTNNNHNIKHRPSRYSTTVHDWSMETMVEM